MSFPNSSNFDVYGGAYSNAGAGTQVNTNNTTNHGPTTYNIPDSSHSDDITILRDLAKRAAMNAAHDSDPVSALNCHPDTRVRILKELKRWISKRKPTTRVQWISGSAGVGKSAIAQKTAENHRDQLVGAFFFSRNDATRDKLDSFVATIAYQCCTSRRLRKTVGPLIIDAIRSDPNVFSAPAKVQFRKLILEPFSRWRWLLPRSIPNLLVIDGIDECVDQPSQERLLEIVDDAITFPTYLSSSSCAVGPSHKFGRYSHYFSLLPLTPTRTFPTIGLQFRSQEPMERC